MLASPAEYFLAVVRTTLRERPIERSVDESRSLIAVAQGKTHSRRVEEATVLHCIITRTAEGAHSLEPRERPLLELLAQLSGPARMLLQRSLPAIELPPRPKPREQIA